jgi:hypothetical protein
VKGWSARGRRSGLSTASVPTSARYLSLMTVTGVTSGAVAIGQFVGGASAGTYITAGAGTSWTVSNAQALGSAGAPVALTLGCLTDEIVFGFTLKIPAAGWATAAYAPLLYVAAGAAGNGNNTLIFVDMGADGKTPRLQIGSGNATFN